MHTGSYESPKNKGKDTPRGGCDYTNKSQVNIQAPDPHQRTDGNSDARKKRKTASGSFPVAPGESAFPNILFSPPPEEETGPEADWLRAPSPTEDAHGQAEEQNTGKPDQYDMSDDEFDRFNEFLNNDDDLSSLDFNPPDAEDAYVENAHPPEAPSLEPAAADLSVSIERLKASEPPNTAQEEGVPPNIGTEQAGAVQAACSSQAPHQPIEAPDVKKKRYIRVV